MDARSSGTGLYYLNFVSKFTGQILPGRFVIWSDKILIHEGTTMAVSDKGALIQVPELHFYHMEEFFLSIGGLYIDLSEL